MNKGLLLLLFFSFPLLAEQWRDPNPDDLVYIQLPKGQIVIELAPFMAPHHVRQFKALVREGFYDGLDFYRVIEGFVAQAGDVEETRPSKYKGMLKAEFSRNIAPDSAYTLVQSPEFIAPQTGYLQGFAAGRDPQAGLEWLLHCPGTVAMARNNEADSGSTDFYIVIGQAPRHLDRNMSVFGRVIYGMEYVQALPRGNPEVEMGVIKDAGQRGKIEKAWVASDMPADQRLILQVQEQDSEAVQKRLASARTMDSPFYHFRGNGKLDICYYPLKSRLRPSDQPPAGTE
ncbi:peptidylprolyl isomerase [Bowmanella dokdonensis]|uniref:peptidylprolyl isomerase n=1 Tax=Bowmanella dokdonensis TaxID=751969 RepID=A0A939DMM8_9ALTE|nr:peptidylprolyl isomerase [Bowmanella dokdonensis]MBN7825384.1 peptidylprolyl isomerase [Bowmanella dokdonensis]